jgi:hypothetical protein
MYFVNPVVLCQSIQPYITAYKAISNRSAMLICVL